MKKNVGLYDRLLRVIISVGLLILASVHVVPGYWNVITWLVAAILLLTAVFAICPLYGACGINTRRHGRPSDVKTGVS